jgi:hypothetical protein
MPQRKMPDRRDRLRVCQIFLFDPNVISFADTGSNFVAPGIGRGALGVS